MPKHASRRGLSLLALLVLALFAPLPLLAQQANPASNEDIERLLDASRAQSLLANLLPQVDANQRQQFDRITAGKELTTDQQTQLDSIQTRTTDTLHQALSWEQVKPLYMDIYRQNFSRDDIRAITKFYESDAGQHMLDKNPLLVQGLMQAIQQKVTPTLTELEGELQQAVDVPPPAPPVSPPQAARAQPAAKTCKKVKVKGKLKTVCKAAATKSTVKKKASTSAQKSTAKKPAAKKTTTKKAAAATPKK